jgi:hypothetical protein
MLQPLPAGGRGRRSRGAQDLAFRFHDAGVGAVLVIVSLQVQHTMHDQVGEMRLQRLALRGGLAHDHHRHAPGREVAGQHRRARVGEGQHVGGVILAAVLRVQRAPLGSASTKRTVTSAAPGRARAPPAHLGARRQRGLGLARRTAR